MRTIARLAAAAVLSVGAFLAAAPADAARIVSSFSAPAGPYNLGNPTGTIAPTQTLKINTYDWKFSTTGTFSVLLHMHASFIPQPLAFSLFSGAPGTGTLVATSGAMQFDPIVTQILNAGNYYVEVDPSGFVKREELMSGDLTISPVPEPAEWALMITGVGLLGLAARRRRSLATA